ncbi:ATP-binding cassette sub-family B member 10, mitochondrial-like isoform X2 [Rhodnius prolixus]
MVRPAKEVTKSLTKTKRKVVPGELKRIMLLAKPEALNITGAVLLLLVSSSVTMAVPFALGRVIDLIYSTDSEVMKGNLHTFCAILLGVFIVGGLCNFGRVYLMNMSAQRITKALREKVFCSILRQEVAFFDKNKTGELINRLSADTSVVSNSVTMNVSDGLRSSITVVAGMSMMFYMSSYLAFISLCIVPPVAAMAIIYGRFIKKLTGKVQDSLAEATQVAEERIANIRTVKTFSKEEAEIKIYNERMEDILKLAKKESLARGIFFGMAGLSGNAIALSVLYCGGLMVSDQTLSVGDLSAFVLYAAYIGVSIGGLSAFYSELNKGLGASTTLWQIIDRKPDIPSFGNIRSMEEISGKICFSSVEFAYPTRIETPVLKGIDLVVPKGNITAVVGASGSGKSTLAYLLLGLYLPTSGQVTVDGVPIHKYNLQWLRDHIGSVSQEPVLFSGSVKENILYGAPEGRRVNDDDLDRVLREANAYDFVYKDLPKGVNTVVGERGIMLSGGQKQRIAIARALIKDPTILILDEATSALDAESEHLVQEALERILKGRTVLTIAHRLSTIKNSDQIAVLEAGKIVELGTYEDLNKIENGVFRKLVKHQTFQLA